MALTLGITGMDSPTEAEVRTAFNAANAETGNLWTLIAGDAADYVVIDMDSLYGPMSWMRLHAAGRKVIGVTSVERNQTDYRLPRPITTTDFAVLLSEIAGDAPRTAAAPVVEAKVEAKTETKAKPPAVAPVEPPAAQAPTAPTPEPPQPVSAPEPEPVVLSSERTLAQWLRPGGLDRRVRLQHGDGPVLLIDPRNGVWHGPQALKAVAACFNHTLSLLDFATPDATAWESEAASLGAAQPLSRLQWLGGLVSGHGALLPGFDPNGQYRLNKWPQTEREYPKHFRIATAMMKGPATVAEVAEASGVSKEEVADFINANLATGFAEPYAPPPPEPETPQQKGGLFGRMRR
ncbi:MAG: hypothetical protein QM612_05885 [Thermomonas sp.]|uniref:hypothetical protein n=1 Tax=Thermomonas sp. TaxID=1971895 RepID=UPI0039E60B6D